VNHLARESLPPHSHSPPNKPGKRDRCYGEQKPVNHEGKECIARIQWSRWWLWLAGKTQIRKTGHRECKSHRGYAGDYFE